MDKGANVGVVKRFICSLLAGLGFHSPALAEQPMTFFADTSEQERFIVQAMHGGVYDIYASGEITEGTTDRFLAFVRAHNIEAAKVHLNSPGGSLSEGMKLGRAFRALQFFTTVGLYNPTYEDGLNSTSICASACAYAFAGGVSRFLDQYTGRLGVHQFYGVEGTGASEGTIQQISGLVVAYLDEMGVDAKAFTLSTAAERDGMIWLTPDLALFLRFANNGSKAPIAEIRLAGMLPYLRVEQEHYNVTTRVLFGCENKKIQMSFGIVTDPEHTGLFLMAPKRSYLELDHKEFLVVPGAAGVQGKDSVAWIGRSLTPATLSQLIRATVVDGWIDGSGAVRYGAGLEMPTVREKILDFAKQCYGMGAG